MLSEHGTKISSLTWPWLPQPRHSHAPRSSPHSRRPAFLTIPARVPVPHCLLPHGTLSQAHLSAQKFFLLFLAFLLHCTHTSFSLQHMQRSLGKLPERLPSSVWEQEWMRGFTADREALKTEDHASLCGRISQSWRDVVCSRAPVCRASVLTHALTSVFTAGVATSSPASKCTAFPTCPQMFGFFLVHVTSKIILTWHGFRQSPTHMPATLPSSPVVLPWPHALTGHTYWPLLSLQTGTEYQGESPSWVWKPVSHSAKRTELPCEVLSLLLTWWRPVPLCAALTLAVLIGALGIVTPALLFTEVLWKSNEVMAVRVFRKWRDIELEGTVIMSEFGFREQAGREQPAL